MNNEYWAGISMIEVGPERGEASTYCLGCGQLRKNAHMERANNWCECNLCVGFENGKYRRNQYQKKRGGGKAPDS